MKIVFYRSLLNRGKNITPSERILYSFLVAKSISRLDQIFESNGVTLNTEELVYQIKENNNRLDICNINHSKIATELHQTRKTVIDGMRHLQQLGFIGDMWIYVNQYLIENGYFELLHSDILKGELLIFYSYLRDKSAKYGYCIDTYKNMMAECFGKSKVAITKLLNRLYESGLAERLDNGKLLIK